MVIVIDEGMAFSLKLKRVDLQMIAEELGVEFTEDDTRFQLKKKIMDSEDYEEGSIMELSNAIVAERLEREKLEKQEKLEREEKQEKLEREEKQEKLEREKLERDREERLEREKLERDREERLEREKLERDREERLEREKLEREREERAEKLRMEHELEMERLRVQGSTSNSNGSRDSNNESNIEKLIKSVKTLSIKVPEGTEGWNLFFNSLARAFKTKNVPENQQAEILLNMLGDKADNLLIYTTREQIESYEELKGLVLREHEPTPKNYYGKLF